ncbi:GntR family transcriptional regulator [Microvirga alba]|uniref:GntR family transcriptional regulator n=1 Tax=Microvirga alba TaxID=2791025 RepID=A0A931BTH3_9HYPH|nr:GntR family transcriptional regulator [Microvirga alba]MBF9235678.1 GntR family transcriptional regulator [Microvirga alba]
MSKRSAGRPAAGEEPSVEMRLRKMIAEQELLPGEAVREEHIAKLLSVSRHRIREALAALEERRLIIRTPNRGAVVAQLSFEEILELFEIRISLESLCVRLAVQNTRPQDWQDLRELFGEPSERLVEAHDLDGYFRNIELFRERFVQASGSKTLQHLLEIIADRDRALLRRTIILPERAEQGLKMQRAILDAMCAGDAEKAEQLKRESIIRARDAVIRYRSFVT